MALLSVRAFLMLKTYLLLNRSKAGFKIFRFVLCLTSSSKVLYLHLMPKDSN